MNRETLDSIDSMRYGMEQGLRDLKWKEVEIVNGRATFLSPGDSICFVMSSKGPSWVFACDDMESPTARYTKVFAEGDTWKEFERALLLAQAIEEEKLGTRQDLIGKWWDSWHQGITERRAWFATRELHPPAAICTNCGWRVLTGHERETITNEVLKGVTK